MLGSVDIESRVVQETAVLPECIEWPSILPDGRLVGTARVTSEGDSPGDTEIVIVDPADGNVIPLTAGPFDEEYPFASTDGSRIVFSRRLEDWPTDFDLGLFRRVVCWVDVP